MKKNRISGNECQNISYQTKSEVWSESNNPRLTFFSYSNMAHNSLFYPFYCPGLFTTLAMIIFQISYIGWQDQVFSLMMGLQVIPYYWTVSIFHSFSHHLPIKESTTHNDLSLAAFARWGKGDLSKTELGILINIPVFSFLSHLKSLPSFLLFRQTSAVLSIFILIFSSRRKENLWLDSILLPR